MNILESHIVPEGNYNTRIADYLPAVFENAQTKSSIKKLIAQQRILLNGNPAKTADWIKKGQLIELAEDPENPPKIFELDLNILYEDEFIAIVHKPAGYPVSGNLYRTIYNSLPHNLKKSNKTDALDWPKPVHRLDASTSGLLLVAKTRKCRIELGSMFEKRLIHKTYHAVVTGKPQVKGIIKEELNGQPSKTHFEVLKSVSSLQNKYLSLIKVEPKTGRTHQIRKHFAGIDHPIVGDKLYGDKEKMLKHKGLFLCAVSLAFEHPILKTNIEVKINHPSKFDSLFVREKRRWKKFKKEL